MMFEAEVPEVFTVMLNDAGFSSKGTITSCDSLFALLHGYGSGEEALGQHIADLIPSVQLPPPGEPVPQVGPCGPLTATPCSCTWGHVAPGVCLLGDHRVLRLESMAWGHRLVILAAGASRVCAQWHRVC